MLQTETKKSRIELCEAYQAKYLVNSELEWLIECGNIRESVYFKGATGDRYTIYVAVKRTKNIIDLHNIWNTYSHGTSSGNHMGILRGYVLNMVTLANNYWYSGCGGTFRQIMRQGVQPRNPRKQWTIRYCRSAYLCKLNDSTEFTPWLGMKIDIKNGVLVNKPNRKSIKDYKLAKDTDRERRKANRLANKNNAEALTRYHAANGNFALLPMDDVFKHRNVEYRTDIMNFYGLEKILNTLETKVEDEDTIDGRFYRLINVKIPDLASGQARHNWGLYLEMINPSTGESHFEGIANVAGQRGAWGGSNINEATVKAALSWRDGDGIVTTGRTWDVKATSSNYVIPIKLT